MNRFEWACSEIDLHQDDNVLEIGCGSGILAAMIAQQLIRGTVTAVDRSAMQIARASKKYKSIATDGKLNFLNQEFPAEFESKRLFDKVIGFNVRAMWTDGDIVRRLSECLTKKGSVYIFFQPPDSSASALMGEAKKIVLESGVQILKSKVKKLSPVDGFVIQFKP